MLNNITSADNAFLQTLRFYMERQRLVDDQCFSITKGSIYHTNHMDIQPLITVVDWPEIRCLMEGSTVFYIYLQIRHFYLVYIIICT